MADITERFKNAWNVFRGTKVDNTPHKVSYIDTPYRSRGFSYGNENSLKNAVFVQIAIDVASVTFRHMRVNDEGYFTEEIKSYLNECLTTEANIDQSAFAFKLDMVLNMMEQGHIVILPVDTTKSILSTGGSDIVTMRVGKVTKWEARHVTVRAWNDEIGDFEEVRVPKASVGIVENPFYTVINEPNSTFQRLVRKLNILDAVDEQSGSGKLDVIIQLPYSLRTDYRQNQAEKRKKDIEVQLRDSKYGIAYIDAAERITQLNRPAENNLLNQIEYLTKQLYNQFGVSEAVFDGTADDLAMLNYQSRIIMPIVTAITEEMNRKFLTKTARTQKQRIGSYFNPFKFVPVEKLAELADKFTRNEILTSNEIRAAMLGFRPYPDEKADQLINSNLSQPKENLEEVEKEEDDSDLVEKEEINTEEGDHQNDSET